MSCHFCGILERCSLDIHSVLFTHSIIILFHVSYYKLASRARGIFLMRLSVEEYGVFLGGGDKKCIGLIEDLRRPAEKK